MYGLYSDCLAFMACPYFNSSIIAWDVFLPSSDPNSCLFSGKPRGPQRGDHHVCPPLRLDGWTPRGKVNVPNQREKTYEPRPERLPRQVWKPFRSKELPSPPIDVEPESREVEDHSAFEGTDSRSGSMLIGGRAASCPGCAPALKLGVPNMCRLCKGPSSPYIVLFPRTNHVRGRVLYWGVRNQSCITQGISSVGSTLPEDPNNKLLRCFQTVQHYLLLDQRKTSQRYLYHLGQPRNHAKPTSTEPEPTLTQPDPT